MKKRRGFSIVEVVISLLLIAIMAAGVFSTISVSINLKRKNTIRASALREIENVAKCLSSNNINNALEFYAERPVEEEGNAYTLYYNADGDIINMVSDDTPYDFKITAALENEKVNKFTANFYNGDLIYEWEKSNENA